MQATVTYLQRQEERKIKIKPKTERLKTKKHKDKEKETKRQRQKNIKTKKKEKEGQTKKKNRRLSKSLLNSNSKFVCKLQFAILYLSKHQKKKYFGQNLLKRWSFLFNITLFICFTQESYLTGFKPDCRNLFFVSQICLACHFHSNKRTNFFENFNK